MKVYRYDTFTCCSGTYIQNMADYHNLIYYKDAASLYVNLYVPSEVHWHHQGNNLKMVQRTEYPAAEVSTLTLDMKQSMELSLKFRVPEWSQGMSITVNGAATNAACTPGTWATVARTWDPQDRVEVRIPLRFRMQPVDRQHPHRVAIVRGPLVMAFDFTYYEPTLKLPDNDDDLNDWLVPYDGPAAPFTPPTGPAVFRVQGADGRTLTPKFRPFYHFAEGFPYLMYIDAKAWPAELW
jgi:DUF1680 family protein